MHSIYRINQLLIIYQTENLQEQVMAMSCSQYGTPVGNYAEEILGAISGHESPQPPHLLESIRFHRIQ